MEKGQTNNLTGRPKGVPDKRTTRVQDELTRLNCNPIEFLALVVNADPRLKDIPDMNQRITAAKELASYIAPKLKSIEHTGDNSAVEIMQSLFGHLNARK